MAAKTLQNIALVADKTPKLNEEVIEIPEPASNQVLVEISHVAQNPTDIQSFDNKAFGDTAVYGCDFSGKVVKLGSEVSQLKENDQIAGLIWGGEKPYRGAYAHYTVADEKISFKIPKSISPAAASTIPLAANTAWLAMFSKGCLDMDRNQKQTILVWGGSSSVGQYTIQLARLQGFKILTTCSPRNFDLVKKLGATHVLNYADDDVSQQIQKAAPELRYIFDTIGNETSSATACKSASDPSQAVMCTVRPGKTNTDNVPKGVKITDVMVWTAFLSDHQYAGFKWPASMDDHKLSVELYEALPGWIESGEFVPNDTVMKKGLSSVNEGFDLYRQGKISAQKIVYEL